MYQTYQQYYTKRKDIGKYRQLPESQFKPTLDFSTNDYLALSQHEALLAAAVQAGKTYGTGATGSRLFSGNQLIFEQLEERIAFDKNTESALIFNSGFQTNITVLSSLLDASILGKPPIVFFDKLNHASLYQALFLSGAEIIRYHHNDMQHLSDKLSQFKNVDRPKFIVAETLFGMDGDILPIQDVTHLAFQHSAFLYLDEAHAMGILGQHGYGLSTTVDLHHIPYLIMGTFSKALGSSGGYIACSQILKNYLINKAPGFIYSTAPSPMAAGAALKAWDMVKSFENEREKLFALSSHLRTALNHKGFNTGESASHIIPVILGNEDQAMQVKDTLQKEGILVSAVRPPTVPPGTSRLRIALNIQHTEKDIDQLAECLEGTLRSDEVEP